MNKKVIAVIFGGRSSEHEVSLQSAYSVLSNVSAEEYEIIPIGISKEGEWYKFSGKYESIRDNLWLHENEQLTPIAFLQSPSAHGFIELSTHKTIQLDAVFPVLHGKNGEDGTVQGLLELASIPIIGCGSVCSAICMDKSIAHIIVKAVGISVPKGIVVNTQFSENDIEVAIEGLKLPLFVKPVRAGSSFGITKINSLCEAFGAVQLALSHDDEVIIEECIDGFEVGCAIIGDESPIIGRVDEIELSGGFFDFNEKYTLKSAKIHMPARISEATEKNIQNTALLIYKALGCKGFARVDMFITHNDIVFNEVNTIPGFTAHSRFPSMMKGIGLTFNNLINRLISNCLSFNNIFY